MGHSLRVAKARNISLWELLVLDRLIPEDAVAEGLSKWLNLPSIRLTPLSLDPDVVRLLPERVLRRHTCVPVRIAGRTLVLAMADPLNHDAIKDVEFLANRPVQRAVAPRTEVLEQIEKFYPACAETAEAIEPEYAFDLPAAAGATGAAAGSHDPVTTDRPIIDLCNQLIRDAIAMRASDIHIEPTSKRVRIRLRVDGALRDHEDVPRWMHAALVGRIKVLAGLDIAQQRLPQDGRIQIEDTERRLELRVSTLPTHAGERVVLRLLGSSELPTLEEIGVSPSQLAVLEDALTQPQGLIVVTGPTGAGKSTTLYSMLARRQAPDINILTIEDPVEYNLPGINQVQVDKKSGLTFASGLRSILRQDPDVILIGEVRDHETAEISMHAALTGHLVLSTVHANSALATIERFRDLDVTSLSIAAAVNLIVAQRLARRICPNCRVSYHPSADTLRRLSVTARDMEFSHGAGCSSCGDTGYAGRIGIFELLRLTPSIKKMLTRHAGEDELRAALEADGATFMMQDALAKVRDGLTTVEEVLRVIRSETDERLPSSHRLGTSRRTPRKTPRKMPRKTTRQKTPPPAPSC